MKERPRRIFVNSMSDLFHENVPDEWIDKIFALMALCPQHQFQVLTKRPERMREYLLQVQDEEKDMQRWMNAAGEIGACARWVLNRYPKEDVVLLNSNAGGNEHPLTEAFVKEYSEKVHPVIPIEGLVKDIDDRPGVIAAMGLDPETVLTFPLLAKIMKRFPSKRMQVCTQFLKNAPARRWVRERDTELGDYERYSGKRRDESASRSRISFREWSEYFDCPMNYPICDWTKQMCFDYVRQYGEPINPLYSLGFERVGCAPCVNSGKHDMKLWADRFPGMVEKVRAWEEEVGSTFFPPKVPGMKMNFVDDVVEWSRTDRGGRQFNILNTLERPACESKFGLCE